MKGGDIIFRKIVINGAEIYVSENGIVIWNNTQRKHYLNKDGYPVVSIKTDKGWRSIGLARLVAIAFIPNPNNLPEVNHKDYNRQNYQISNLEWISHKDNIIYSKCNRPNVCGKNNPNYGNQKLSSIYAKNKRLSKEKQSRPGLQNGMCKHIKLFYDNKLIAEYDWIRPCLEYIQKHSNPKSSIDSIASSVRRSIRNNKPYLGHYTFEKK